MKITNLETFLVPPRWAFLKIETDAGISGWGEPVLEGHAATCAAQVAEYADFLIGRDPLMIEDIWQMLYRNGCYRDGPVIMSAISGIDMALWDIKGKFHDAPVHALLGGKVRDRIRTYCWVGGDRPENLIEATKKAKRSGLNAVKMNVCGELQIVASNKDIDDIVARFGALRDGVGNGMDLALDFHGRVHTPMASILLKELAPIHPIFVEDPVLGSHLDNLADLQRATSIPLATGERIHATRDFKQLFETRAVRIINPDTAHVGGISAIIKLGRWAEAYDIALAPHCPLGPIALAACLQVDAVCYNAFIQEQSLGIHYNSEGKDLLDYLKDQSVFEIDNGFLNIPEGPGLGIEVDEERVREASTTGHRWRAPVWRHADGSIAEW